jgi:hypothetical protein
MLNKVNARGQEVTVKHYSIAFWRKKEAYIEGNRNGVTVQLSGGSLWANFTNSHGDPGHMEGSLKQAGPLLLVKGKAYGYKEHPEGRKAVSLGITYRGVTRLIVPSSLTEFLTIKLDHTKEG